MPRVFISLFPSRSETNRKCKKVSFDRIHAAFMHTFVAQALEFSQVSTLV